MAGPWGPASRPLPEAQRVRGAALLDHGHDLRQHLLLPSRTPCCDGGPSAKAQAPGKQAGPMPRKPEERSRRLGASQPLGSYPVPELALATAPAPAASARCASRPAAVLLLMRGLQVSVDTLLLAV